MTSIAELWRFPVKSMQGERVGSAEVTERGLAGDRAFALVDAADGHVASAKNPRKWGQLLEFSACTADGGVEITFPDGATVRADDPDVDARLSAAVGREIRLMSTSPDAGRYEMFFPDIEGVAPADIIAATRTADEEGGTLTAQMVGVAAPPGTLFDVATLHVVTSSTLRTLGTDVRRFRPNVVVDTDGDGFVENGWAGKALTLGGVSAAVLMPTMRCVMTTLPQPGLERDRSLLQRLAQDNRLDIPGLGEWACAGVYGAVTTPGSMAVGDEVTITG